MADVFYTDDILEAARALLKPAMTFTAKIVEKGDLSFWPEGDVAKMAAKLPAVFIQPVQTLTEGVSTDAVTALSIETITELRIIVVDKFDPVEEDVTKKRTDHADAIANRFYAATALDMGASIAGFRFFQAWATRLEFKPEEDNLVSIEKDRNLFAVAVEVSVRGEADRL